MSGQGVGRLASGPHPELFARLYAPALQSDLEHVLPWLLRIDAAHVLMLGAQTLLPKATVRALLEVNRALEALRREGKPPFAIPETHRGLYYLYEGEYVRRLGPLVGGSAHLGRSRNDINAAVLRLRAREAVLSLSHAAESLGLALVAQGRAHRTEPMAGFTHLQPAQPSSLGHHLAAVGFELVRAAEWLAECWPTLNQSPLGAAAAFGTSLPIDPAQVAGALGFDGAISNSADAVGSRDVVVRVLAPLASMGTTLTRLALDLQTWGSQAYGFIDWGDELVSTSSIMPQKRNAFVLENVRGQAVRASGALVDALMGMKNTPFTNGVEVSGEAASHLWPGVASTGQALALMRLLVEQLVVKPERLRAFLEGKNTTLTALADLLVQHGGLPFRTAHEVVGALVARAPNQVVDAAFAEAQLPALLESHRAPKVALTKGQLADAFDPRRVLEAARHGGGPAPDAVAAQLEALEGRWRALERLRLARTQGIARALEQLDARIQGEIAT